jgi:hypothetical protein
VQVYYFYSYGTAAWMGKPGIRFNSSGSTDRCKATQALPLIASPTMMVALLSPEVREATSKHATTLHPFFPAKHSALALEVYFSQCLGFSLLAIGVLNVLLTGSVPLSSRLTEGKSPLSHASFFITTLS